MPRRKRHRSANLLVGFPISLPRGQSTSDDL
jgi:hypothetical protein